MTIGTRSDTSARAPETEPDEDDRPWRGVFAIESPCDCHPCGKLFLPTEPLPSAQQAVDILWEGRRCDPAGVHEFTPGKQQDPAPHRPMDPPAPII